MRVGFVGLGKMGSQIVSRLLAAKYEVVVTDIDHAAVKECVKAGAIGAFSREELVQQLGPQPIVWLMIPSNFTHDEILAYQKLLPPGAILIDGGNSDFQTSIEHAGLCKERGISFVDVGTSGGVLGLKNGFSMMVGGAAESFDTIEPILQVLAAPSGSYAHMGPSGYGHYVKMIHNGIEYGLMQAYAEGYDLLKYGPMQNIDLEKAAHVWQHGSIIASTLNGLTEQILHDNPELKGIDGYVADSGEGRWTQRTADIANVAMPALTAALDVRSLSQQGHANFATKLLAAMRHAFGGHPINKK